MVPRINDFIHLQTFIKDLQSNKNLIIFLVALTVIAVFFRFYKFEHLIYWMFDEERDAFIVKRIIADKHFTLIGPSIPGAFYMSPGYFYIMAIPYLFSHGNPVGPAIFASTLGVITTLILFYTSSKMFGRTVGQIASLIYATSYLVVIYDRNFWPLVFDPLIAIVVYFSLYKLIRTRNYRWSLLMALALILGLNSTPEVFSLIFLIFVVWLLFKLSLKNKLNIFAFSFCLFSLLPLALFDLRHNFLNSKILLHLFSYQNQETRLQIDGLMEGIKILPNVFSRFIYVSSTPDTAIQINPHNYYISQKFQSISPLLVLFSLIMIIWFLTKYVRTFKQKNNPGYTIVGTHLLISILGITIYNLFFPGYTHEWFFHIIFPAFAIITALFIFELFRSKPLLLWALVGTYIIIQISLISKAINSSNLKDKMEAVSWAVQKVYGSQFSLDSIGTSFGHGGYRYLFYQRGYEPIKSYADPTFANWLYPKNNVVQYPDTIVVMVNPDFYFDEHFEDRYKSYSSKSLSRKKFGRIEVLIVDNNEKWVNW